MKKYSLLFFILILPLICLSQNTIEITAGAGFTGVNLDDLVEKDENPGTTVTDWDQFCTSVGGQYFLGSGGRVSFGAELMYHYLYWYSVRVPFGSQVINREYSVSVVRLAPIARLGAGSSFSFDVGPEVNFSDRVDVGLLLSANYNIIVSERIEIPIKLRLDVMNRIVVTAPITLNAGVRLNL